MLRTRKQGEKRVILHLGAHKTGTSLLQKYMRDSPDDLHRNGVYFLSRSETDRCIGWGERLTEDPTKLAGWIAEYLGDPRFHTFVVSHENSLGRPVYTDVSPDILGREGLYPQAAEFTRALAHACQPYRTSAIFYIRSQEDFLESYYLQRVHEGARFGFSEWVEHIGLDAVSWCPLIEELRDALGAGAVQVADFAEMKDGQNSFIERFMKRLCPRFDAHIDYRPMRNPSVSAKGLAMALAVNPHLRSHGERKAVRKFLQRSFSNAQYPRPELFSPSEKTEIQNRYAEENRRLVSTSSLDMPGDPARG